MGQRRRPSSPPRSLPFSSSSSSDNDNNHNNEHEEEHNHGMEESNGGRAHDDDDTLVLLHPLHNSCNGLSYNFLGSAAADSSCSRSIDDEEVKEVCHHHHGRSDYPYDDDDNDRSSCCTTLTASETGGGSDKDNDDNKELLSRHHNTAPSSLSWLPRRESSIVTVEGDNAMTCAEDERGRESAGSAAAGSASGSSREEDGTWEKVGDVEGREETMASLPLPIPLPLPLPWRLEEEEEGWEDDDNGRLAQQQQQQQQQQGRPSSPPLLSTTTTTMLPMPSPKGRSLEEWWTIETSGGGGAVLRPPPVGWAASEEEEEAIDWMAGVEMVGRSDQFLAGVENDDRAVVQPPTPLLRQPWLWSSLLGAVAVLAIYRWWGWDSTTSRRRERNDDYDIHVINTTIPALPLRMALREKWVRVTDVVTTHWHATLGTFRDTIGAITVTTTALFKAIVLGRSHRPPPLPPDLIVLPPITNGRGDNTHHPPNCDSKDNAVLEPSFLREEDYPDGWLVYHPTLGVVLKEVADKHDREAANGGTPATPPVGEPDDDDATDELHLTPHPKERKDEEDDLTAAAVEHARVAAPGTPPSPMPPSCTPAAVGQRPDRQRAQEATDDQAQPTMSDSNAATSSSSTSGQLAVLRTVAANG